MQRFDRSLTLPILCSLTIVGLDLPEAAAHATLRTRDQEAWAGLSLIGLTDSDIDSSREPATTTAMVDFADPEIFSGVWSASASLSVTPLFDTNDKLTQVMGSGSVAAQSPAGASIAQATTSLSIAFTVDSPLNFNLELTDVPADQLINLGSEANPFYVGRGVTYLLDAPGDDTDISEPGGGFTRSLDPGDYTLTLLFLAGSPTFESTSASLDYDFVATFEEEVSPSTDFFWINSSGGSFGNSDNWDPAQFPDENTEAAVFDLGGAYTVTFPSGFENRQAVVTDGVVTFDLAGTTYLLNSGADSGLTVENAGTELTLQGGNLRATRINVLNDALLSITGPGDVSSENDMRVSGPLGSIATISNGAEVATNGDLFLGGTSGNGLLLLDNAFFTGFRNLFAAGPLSGLTVENGATAAFAAQVSLSDDASGFIDGAGSFVGADRLVTVSNSKFRVSNGANSSFTSADINGPASPPNSPLPPNLEITGVNSRLTFADSLSIGHIYAADTLVNDGATLEVGSLNLGGGVITVSNNATLEVEGHAETASSSGIATIEVVSGGRFSSDSLSVDNRSVFRVAEQGSATVRGTINVSGFSVFDISGSSLAAGVDLHIDDSSSVNVSNQNSLLALFGDISVAGSLQASDGASIVADGSLTIAESGTVSGGGAIEVGAVVNDGGGFLNQGLLSPGNSPGVLTIIGDYRQPDPGTMLIEIAGQTPGSEYDQVIIDGDATITGNIIFSFIDGFAPREGDTFDFLSVTGNADLSEANLLVRGLLDGFLFSVNPAGDAIRLTALTDGVAVPEPSNLLLGMTLTLACYGLSPWRMRL